MFTSVLSICPVIALIWLCGTCVLKVMFVFEEFEKVMHDDDENYADGTYTLAGRCWAVYKMWCLKNSFFLYRHMYIFLIT